MFKKFLNKAIATVFGDKKKKDIDGLAPYVDLVNDAYAQLQHIDNDALRNKTEEFRGRIQQHLQGLDDEVKELKDYLDANPAMGKMEKEEVYTKVDTLEKDRNTKLEEVLLELLPEAFAVVKETAKRFKENTMLRVRATDLDRDLSLEREHIEIDGDHAIYQNAWMAAGNMITWDMVHYDVQIIGGVALHQGKIAEMQTGEGKTLVATLPAYLNGLSGRGVHLITVNNYLALRDSEWMGGIYEFLGLTVDCLDKYRPNSEERRKAYRADITFGTNNEFGFDYLRDNMTRNPEELVQRKHHYAMIDEVDSVLVDDARTPLIISGPVERGDEHEFHDLKPRIVKLMDVQKKLVTEALVNAKKLIKEGQTDEKTGGLQLLRAFRGFPRLKPLIKFLNEPGMKSLLQKTENFYMQEQNKNMHIVDEELFFTIDEKQNAIDLTEQGINLITGSGDDPNFFIIPDIGSVVAQIENSDKSEEERQTIKAQVIKDYTIKTERIHSVQQLLKAYALFEKDVEYILADGKVKIVDESTGRIMEGRRYSDGLHQAIEAKEDVEVEAATQTFATITLQNFFRMYHKLAGMTGTAETEAGEFWDIYKLDVVVIPTNRPVARADKEDLIYKTVREKYNAVINEVLELRAAGRPILIGTTTVEVSELLSRALNMKGIEHNVLNAKQHLREAEIVAQAGQAGQVTIATNMAGRGTDIKLSDSVKAAGGLAIIGTERHDSRRVDRQLRGRAGRQGDPGSSQFFVSLEDKLMRLFGSERIAGLMDKMGYVEGEVLQHSMITKSIERAQKKVEENNFGVRKRLLEYDDVMNAQREVIYRRRRHALFGDRLSVDLANSFQDLADEITEIQKAGEDYNAFVYDSMRYFSIQPEISKTDFDLDSIDSVSQRLYTEAMEAYNRKKDTIRERTKEGLAHLFEEKGGTVKKVLVPFSDGKRGLNIPVNLEKAVTSDGHAIVQELEKNIMLSFIDDKWKEHLREMDQLKQSVQLAVHEQKDPLLIYKFESFEMFKQMLGDINRDVADFLFKADLPKQEPLDEAQVRAARQQQLAQQKEREKLAKQTTTNKEPEQKQQQVGSGDMQRARAASARQSREATRPNPAKVGPRVGRNEPCPCGSGKKYKKCHGKDA